MRNPKYHIYLTPNERRTVINSLIDLRNVLILRGKYTIKQYRPILYTNLLTKYEISDYLADINERAENMLFRLVDQLTEQEGLTEQLKADNQMLWIQKMNNYPKPGN